MAAPDIIDLDSKRATAPGAADDRADAEFEALLSVTRQRYRRLAAAAHAGLIRIPLKSVGVSITKNCNLNCQFCHLADAGFSKEYMELDRLRYILKDGYSLSDIHLTSAGEAFVHPQIDDIIDVCRDRAPHANIRIITNGIWGVSGRRLAAIEKLNFIAFSIDGATRETFERIRRPAKWDKFLSTLNSVIELRRSRKPELTIRFIFTAVKSNISELPALVQLAADLGGIKGIYCQPMRLRNRKMNELHGEELIDRADPDAVLSAIYEAERVSKATGVGLYVSRAMYPAKYLSPADREKLSVLGEEGQEEVEGAESMS